MKLFKIAAITSAMLLAGNVYADGNGGNGGSDLLLKINNTGNGAIAIGGQGGAIGFVRGPGFGAGAGALAKAGTAYAGSVEVNHACRCKGDVGITNVGNHALAIGNGRAGSVFVNIGGRNPS